jgi:hypothetical protein
MPLFLSMDNNRHSHDERDVLKLICVLRQNSHPSFKQAGTLQWCKELNKSTLVGPRDANF